MIRRSKEDSRSRKIRSKIRDDLATLAVVLALCHAVNADLLPDGKAHGHQADGLAAVGQTLRAEIRR